MILACQKIRSTSYLFLVIKSRQLHVDKRFVGKLKLCTITLNHRLSFSICCFAKKLHRIEYSNFYLFFNMSSFSTVHSAMVDVLKTIFNFMFLMFLRTAEVTVISNSNFHNQMFISLSSFNLIRFHYGDHPVSVFSIKFSDPSIANEKNRDRERVL